MLGAPPDGIRRRALETTNVSDYHPSRLTDETQANYEKHPVRISGAIHMGKGDRRSKRGKIFRGTFGNAGPRTSRYARMQSPAPAKIPCWDAIRLAAIGLFD